MWRQHKKWWINYEWMHRIPGHEGSARMQTLQWQSARMLKACSLEALRRPLCGSSGCASPAWNPVESGAPSSSLTCVSVLLEANETMKAPLWQPSSAHCCSSMCLSVAGGKWSNESTCDGKFLGQQQWLNPLNQQMWGSNADWVSSTVGMPSWTWCPFAWQLAGGFSWDAKEELQQCLQCSPHSLYACF